MVIDYGNSINWDAGNEFAEAMEAASCAQETADIAYDEAREAHKAAQDAQETAQDAAQDAACAQETADMAMERAGEALEKAENASVKIDGNDKVLSQAENGLMSTIRLAHDPATGVLTLSGKQGTVIDAVNLPLHEILTGAEMVTNPEGQPEGTYIALHLSTETGPQTLYIDATDLIDTYASGNAGINVSGYTISLEVDGNSGLAVGANGLSFAPGNAPMTEAQAGKLDGIEAGAQVNTVNSVAGKTGDVTLDKSDVGLSSVDNTADADKPVSTAQATAIAGAIAGAVSNLEQEIDDKLQPYEDSLISHIAATEVHDATAAAIADRMILRDANGRAKIGAPAASDDIARLIDTKSPNYQRFWVFWEPGQVTTWTAPRKGSYLVRVQGGGGGGGGARIYNSAGHSVFGVAAGGGGSGGLGVGIYTFEAGATYTVTVGVKGAAGNVAGAINKYSGTGGQGGTSSFGTLITAVGGGGGGGYYQGENCSFFCMGGYGGYSTGANMLNIEGNSGGSGHIATRITIISGFVVCGAAGGQGAASYYSGTKTSPEGTGPYGIYGAGGGGGDTGSSANSWVAGGEGGGGIVEILMLAEVQ